MPRRPRPSQQQHQLVRKYIGQRLADYYAQPADTVVGTIPAAAAASSSTAVTTARSSLRRLRRVWDRWWPQLGVGGVGVSSLPASNATRPGGLNFAAFWGEWQWRAYLTALYQTNTAKHQGQWITPVELFQPYYSQILGQYCVQCFERQQAEQQQQQKPKKKRYQYEIYELGGGRGTNAHWILSYIQEKKPDMYQQLTYTIVDSSSSLHALQQQTLVSRTDDRIVVHDNPKTDTTTTTTTSTSTSTSTTPAAAAAAAMTDPNPPIPANPHTDRVRFMLKDLMDVAEGKVDLFPQEGEDPSTNDDDDDVEILTVVLGCEVLDNLPHDKIRYYDGGGPTHTHNNNVEQAEVVVRDEDDDEERFVPVSDPLIKMVLERVPSYLTTPSPRDSPPPPSPPSTTTTTTTKSRRRPRPRSATAIWIPTVACGIVEHILQHRPRNTLSFVFADFDWLPPPDSTTDRTTDTATEVITSSSINRDDEGTTEKDEQQQQQQRRKILSQRKLSEWAIGEPIVTDMEGMDHDCYLVKQKQPQRQQHASPSHTSSSHCDILFPTDFEKLATFARTVVADNTAQKTRPQTTKTSSTRKPRGTTADAEDQENEEYEFVVTVQKQSKFLELYGPKEIKATKSWLTGYTPLLHDFMNCSVLTGTPIKKTTSSTLPPHTTPQRTQPTKQNTKAAPATATVTTGKKYKQRPKNKRSQTRRRYPPKVRQSMAKKCIMW